MFYRNVAGQVVILPFLGLKSNQDPVISGASLTILKDGTSSSSAGTLTHVSGGVWKYIFTAGETDAEIVGMVLSATDALPVVLNLVTAEAVSDDASQTTLLAVKAKTDLIGSAQANVALTAAAVIDIGSITGFPTTLVIGDSYDSNSGEIEVTILDANGDLLTTIGDLDLADATIEFTAFRTGDPVSMHLSGTCTYAASIVSITLPSSVTSLGKADFTYEGRLKFTWSADDAQKTFKTTQFKFIENP